MIKSNSMNEILGIVTASKALVENLFNEYMYCDEKWCRPKKEMNLKEKEEGVQSFYRIYSIHNSKATPRVSSCL